MLFILISIRPVSRVLNFYINQNLSIGIRIDLDTDDRMAASDNRLTVVEGRVDLVRRDLGRSHQRLNVVVARAAEDGDAIINEKYRFCSSL